MENNTKALQAAKNGGLAIVDAILKGGDREVPLCDQIVYDMLSTASAHNQISVVKQILSYGYLVDGEDSSRLTSLNRACRSKYNNSRLIELLIEKGADVNKSVKGGMFPLATACHYGKVDLINILIQKGASLYQKSYENHTPLSLAVYYNHVQASRLLLQYGAPVDVKTEDGFSPLMYSAQQGCTEIASMLLNAGASIHRINHQGFTPLMLAAHHGHEQFVQFLLIDHFNNDCINMRNNEGFNALMLAAYYGHLEVVKLLLPHTDEKLSLTPTEASVLMLAVEADHKSIVEYLLSEANILVNFRNKRGVSALYLSAQSGRKEISSLLLEHGAEVNQCTSQGISPLMAASYHGHSETVKLLIDNGAEMELERAEGSGFTALIFAVTKGYLNVVSVLLEAGTLVTDVAKSLAECYKHFHILDSLNSYERNTPEALISTNFDKKEHGPGVNSGEESPEETGRKRVYEEKNEVTPTKNASKDLPPDTRVTESIPSVTISRKIARIEPVKRDTRTDLPPAANIKQPVLVAERNTEDVKLFPTKTANSIETELSFDHNTAQPLPNLTKTPAEGEKLLATNTSDCTDPSPCDKVTKSGVTIKETQTGALLPTNTVAETDTSTCDGTTLPVVTEIEALTVSSTNIVSVAETHISSHVNTCTVQPVVTVTGTQTEAVVVLPTDSAAKTTLPSSSNVILLKDALTSSSVSEDHTSSSADAVTIHHSQSAPANLSSQEPEHLQQILQQLGSNRSLVHVNLIVNDNRVYNINEAETVGLGAVSISHSTINRPEGSQSGEEEDDD